MLLTGFQPIFVNFNSFLINFSLFSSYLTKIPLIFTNFYLIQANDICMLNQLHTSHFFHYLTCRRFVHFRFINDFDSHLEIERDIDKNWAGMLENWSFPVLFDKNTKFRVFNCKFHRNSLFFWKYTILDPKIRIFWDKLILNWICYIQFQKMKENGGKIKIFDMKTIFWICNRFLLKT